MSRLTWQVLRDRSAQSRLVPLLESHETRQSMESSTLDRCRFGARLASLQVTRRIDWVFYTHLAISRVQQFVPRAVRRPYGVFLHGVEIWRPLPPVMSRVLREARVLVANSHFTAERIKDVHPGLGAVAVCPLALPPGSTASSLVAPGQASRRRLVLVVGRMLASERYKGHDELLECWPSVRARFDDAALVFVGEGDDVSRLRQKAAHLGVAASVSFPGFLPDAALHALYDQAAVFAMPSRNEGFGLVYLEAMAHGLPCIGSTADAAREVIHDGTTGYLVHQQDIGALADRLTRLLADPARRTAMGAAGQRRLDQEFSFMQFQQRLNAIFTEAFACHQP